VETQKSRVPQIWRQQGNNFSVRNTNMIDGFERKSVMQTREVLLHKLLRQRNLFYVICLTLMFVHIHSVEPTNFFLLLLHNCLYKVYLRSPFDIHDFTISVATILCVTLIGSVNMQSMYVCLVLNIPQRKLGSLKNYKNSLEATKH
jgi:hypothetical protein